MTETPYFHKWKSDDRCLIEENTNVTFYGTVCTDVESIAKILNEKENELNRLNEKIKQLKKDDIIFFHAVYDILMKYQDLFNREMADEQDIKNTLEQALKHKFPEEIMEVEVTKNLIIIGILSPHSKERALGEIENYLGLNNYKKWYDEGDYAFDHMAYGFYKIKKEE